VSCEVKYAVVDQWTDGFQASVTVTSAKALDSWRIGWVFDDGQRVTQMWDGSVSQDGSVVTATAADYNKSVAAGGSFAVGFLGTWHDGNTSPDAFTLNGGRCTTAH
jgi:FlaG/FlaF family flagellin (archaellin)